VRIVNSTDSTFIAPLILNRYASTKTGLSAETVGSFGEKHRDKADFTTESDSYILRPETVESFYILNKLTGDPIYREWGWEIFQSIEKYCKTDYAYAEKRNVDDAGQYSKKDKMESFFLGETLKYLYLLFDPDSPVDLAKVSKYFHLLQNVNPLQIISLKIDI